MAGKFELYKDKSDKFRFRLKGKQRPGYRHGRGL